MVSKSKIILVRGGTIGLFLTLRLCQVGILVTLLERDANPQPVPRALGYSGAATHALERAAVWEKVKNSGPCFGNLGRRKLAKSNPDGSKSWGDEMAKWYLAAGALYMQGEADWGMLVVGQHRPRENPPGRN